LSPNISSTIQVIDILTKTFYRFTIYVSRPFIVSQFMFQDGNE